jgi:hypothetical protein
MGTQKTMNDLSTTRILSLYKKDREKTKRYSDLIRDGFDLMTDIDLKRDQAKEWHRTLDYLNFLDTTIENLEFGISEGILSK